MAIDPKKSANPNHPFKYYDLFGMLSVCVLMISNTTAQKMMSIGPFTLNAAIIIFPITYIISDMMTEVYGYARARRVAWASVTALFVGDIINCYVLAKMKVMTEGKHMWMRFIGSTIIAEGVDSVVFFTIAFAGVLPFNIMISALLTGWFIKTLYEVIMLPVTYRIVNKLKRIEGVDFYDTNTNFTPFSLKIEESADKK